MKLSAYARKVGVHYRTAWRWFRAGKIKGYQMDTGTIIITEEDVPERSQKVAIYTRVSAAENRPNLDTQTERVYVCDRCGLVMDRDLNAARNLAQLATTVSSTGSDACGEDVRPVSNRQTSTKQEPNSIPGSA